jgi:methylmalonyl-CoA mutase cobalamin-binding subunit
VPVLDGGDAGRVIAAVLEAAQGANQVAGDSLTSQDADDTAHDLADPLREAGFKTMC